ncbi:hypothetical protein MIND_01077700 [Mycena indigotica]|uniref:Uncharacterized protein n=1 Tax=Mycena indigotica TaxID=2126181 RepID=A0A8H6VXD3_9AGAR|nr:uncharacterized protein MIND_01077700 [Mycena indigotica]KAF7295381.1 hypothetical protein MIND_01077700 [Mycena indigotica]
MDTRCPGNTLLGVAFLRDWRWIINTRGYATIVPSPDSVVYALLYTPPRRTRPRSTATRASRGRHVKSRRTPSRSSAPTGHTAPPSTRSCMSMCSARKRARPKPEYVHRINSGICGGCGPGVPEEYVRECLRPFIPEEQEKALGRPVEAGALAAALGRLG